MWDKTATFSGGLLSIKGGNMDAQTLREVMGGSLPLERYQVLLPAYLKAMRLAGITNVKRAAMFAAQLGHESAGLRYQEEIASGSAYEGRRDLGNVQPGDGARFKGHGWIQITGRHNHTAVSKWAHQQGIVPTPDYFVQHPKELGSDKYCWVGPAWYWTVARPQLNALSDAGDLHGATRAINGGLNGLADRQARYTRALAMGQRLLAGKETQVAKVEKRLNYDRSIVKQDTYYWCGPATTQLVIAAKTGRVISESVLAEELGTTTQGTNGIKQIVRVLNQRIGGGWVEVEMPDDPPNEGQVEKFWQHIVDSIDAGVGVPINIWAPVNNYPKASYTSTISPAYGGGFVKHYIAGMGYAVDGAGVRHVWIADSGFRPFGYWITLEQLATLVPPRSYCYASEWAKRATKPSAGGKEMAFTDNDKQLAREVHHELTHRFDSRYDLQRLRRGDITPEEVYKDTMIGYVLNTDANTYDISHNQLPAIYELLKENNQLLKELRDAKK